MKCAGKLGITFFLMLVACRHGDSTDGSGQPEKPADTPHLNVLFFAIDDLNNRLGCYGDPVVQSPNIDRLASWGRRFESAYCQYPLCNPSRTSLLTGLRPDRTGIKDNFTAPRSLLPDMVPLPQYFRQHGYHTADVGKIFHTPYPDPPCWDELLAKDEDWRPKNKAWVATERSDEQLMDGISARAAARFLQGKHDKPFFLAVGFHKPHVPYIAPKKYFDLYDPAKLKPTQTPPGDLGDIPPIALVQPTQGPAGEGKPLEWLRAYYACISFMDAQVGIVLDALRKSGQWDKTVIVLWSDHGYHLGEHGGLWHKMTLFEEAVRVPFIIVAPKMRRPGRASRSLVELLDVFPTLVDLCGLPAPEGLQGKSLRPILENPSAKVKDAAFSQVIHEGVLGRTARTDRWRYTEWGGPEVAELYDHQSDPHEYKNLAKDAHYAEIVARQHDLLTQNSSSPAPPRNESHRLWSRRSRR